MRPVVQRLTGKARIQCWGGFHRVANQGSSKCRCQQIPTSIIQLSQPMGWTSQQLQWLPHPPPSSGALYSEAQEWWLIADAQLLFRNFPSCLMPIASCSLKSADHLKLKRSTGKKLSASPEFLPSSSATYYWAQSAAVQGQAELVAFWVVGKAMLPKSQTWARLHSFIAIVKDLRIYWKVAGVKGKWGEVLTLKNMENWELPWKKRTWKNKMFVALANSYQFAKASPKACLTYWTKAVSQNSGAHIWHTPGAHRRQGLKESTVSQKAGSHIWQKAKSLRRRGLTGSKVPQIVVRCSKYDYHQWMPLHPNVISAPTSHRQWTRNSQHDCCVW